MGELKSCTRKLERNQQLVRTTEWLNDVSDGKKDHYKNLNRNDFARTDQVGNAMTDNQGIAKPTATKTIREPPRD